LFHQQPEVKGDAAGRDTTGLHAGQLPGMWFNCRRERATDRTTDIRSCQGGMNIKYEEDICGMVWYKYRKSGRFII
jgi:hypothetical protein